MTQASARTQTRCCHGTSRLSGWDRREGDIEAKRRLSRIALPLSDGQRDLPRVAEILDEIDLGTVLHGAEDPRVLRVEMAERFRLR